MFDNLVSSVPMIRAGNLRALAIGSAQRLPSLPDIPTLKESGLDFETTAWFAIVAPARTPPPIVARWSAAVAAALRQPDVAARLTDLGALTVASTPEVLGARMREEIVLWGDLIRMAKIKLD
jgi:tripartite-type tricarboxylate transporter receptor subunit TctC